MLQQTTVAAVRSYFEAFVRRWPSVESLALASIDEVLHAWAGLGYYARARNLHKCARAVVRLHDARFPAEEADLQRLPGIGPYTAAAISAIAFGRRATPVDGNVERVMARLFAVETPLPAARPVLRQHAVSLTPDVRCGDYAQAVMDLGATICRPLNPDCGNCPLNGACEARAQGIASDLPRKLPKAARPLRHGVAFWIKRPDGSILLRRRPEDGLLGGMMEIPSTDWRLTEWTLDEAFACAPMQADWQVFKGKVHHTFTHFRLELRVLGAQLSQHANVSGIWCPADRLADYALPSVMRKITKFAVSAG